MNYTERCNFDEISYVIKYPEGYVENKKYPVLFFLHGAGSRGTDINNLLTNPFFEITEKYKDFPFVIIAPQCHTDTWFDMFDKIIGLLKYIVALDFADSERVYGIGASMGGYGIWQLAMSCPDIFAAIVSVCGGGMYWNAARLKNVHVWAFHGEKDKTVFLEESKKMVDAVNLAGGNAILTVYPENGHDAWSDTYGNQKVFEWLLSQKKAYQELRQINMNDNHIFG